MKYSINTYRLYQDETRFASSVHIKVTMKEPVDIDILRKSVNTAIKRYPYFAVHITVDKDGGLVLLPNKKEVVVLPTSDKLPLLASKKVNGHLLYVDCEGRDINFNISHSMCGGKGFQPWVMTTVYQYVVDRFHVQPDAPGIRKPGSPLLPTETAEPNLETLPDEKPIYEQKSKGPAVMIMDYMNGLYNPFVRDPNYCLFTFEQKDLVNFIKENDASVVSFFMVVIAKALNKILPEKKRVIGGETAHSPRESLGIPDSHCDFLSHVFVDYERDMLKWDMEKLGTMTRGQIILQTDPSVSSAELRKLFTLYGVLDKINGLEEKKAFIKKHDPSKGKKAKHGTYLVNYTGQMDWGEVADYVESFAIIIGGHLTFEVTSKGDKIFLAFMRLFNETKYTAALKEVLDELGIPFKLEGPYPKRIPKHILP